MKAIRLLPLITLLLVPPGSAGATLIGDTVTLAHHCCALGTVATGGGPVNSTVEAGLGDIRLLYYSLYYVDVNAENIYVYFNAPNTWDSGVPNAFQGLVVSSLDGPSGDLIVTGFSSIDTNLAGWDDSLASFDDNSVAFNWELLSFTAASYFNATLELQQIPEPTTGLLMLTGLLGVAACRRSTATARSGQAGD